jgi:hypothetical protein
MRYDDHDFLEMVAQKQQPAGKSMEAPVTPWFRRRMTIASLMIVVAIVAVMLALPAPVCVSVIALSVPCLSTASARWLVFRRHRRLAALSFWVAALITNVVVALFCIAPNMNSLAFSLVPVALLVIAAPTIVALGTAWLVMSTRDATNSHSPRTAAAFSVLTLAVLPILTLWTLWPLHLAFRAARPDLELLVNQVAAGMPVRFPRRVGLFNLTAAAVAPGSGHVGLRIHANGAYSTGLVRLNAGATPKTYGPFLGLNFDVYMGGGWWYRG